LSEVVASERVGVKSKANTTKLYHGVVFIKSAALGDIEQNRI
jgi:hypothetical protein